MIKAYQGIKNIKNHFFIPTFTKEVIKGFLNCLLKLRFRSIKSKGNKEYEDYRRANWSTGKSRSGRLVVNHPNAYKNSRVKFGATGPSILHVAINYPGARRPSVWSLPIWEHHDNHWTVRDAQKYLIKKLRDRCN